jgi:hypothetical protein
MCLTARGKLQDNIVRSNFENFERPISDWCQLDLLFFSATEEDPISNFDLRRWSSVSVGISLLDGLGVMNRISGCFSEAYTILHIVLDMRIVSIRVSIDSSRMIAIVQVKWCFTGARLLGVIVGKFRRR